jgi:hypothetical protein
MATAARLRGGQHSGRNVMDDAGGRPQDTIKRHGSVDGTFTEIASGYDVRNGTIARLRPLWTG